jgi:hypothetical protein
MITWECVFTSIEVIAQRRQGYTMEKRNNSVCLMTYGPMGGPPQAGRLFGTSFITMTKLLRVILGIP